MSSDPTSSLVFPASSSESESGFWETIHLENPFERIEGRERSSKLIRLNTMGPTTWLNQARDKLKSVYDHSMDFRPFQVNLSMNVPEGIHREDVLALRALHFHGTHHRVHPSTLRFMGRDNRALVWELSTLQDEGGTTHYTPHITIGFFKGQSTMTLCDQSKWIQCVYDAYLRFHDEHNHDKDLSGPE